jgi:hypothetical protein
MLFCITLTVMEQMNRSITPIGIKNTALEMTSLAEIFNFEKNILPPIYKPRERQFHLNEIL